MNFYSKFGNDKDYVLGNSSQYSSRSVKWNIFREILADGFKEKDYLLNIQEICNSIFCGTHTEIAKHFLSSCSGRFAISNYHNAHKRQLRVKRNNERNFLQRHIASYFRRFNSRRFD